MNFHLQGKHDPYLAGGGYHEIKTGGLLKVHARLLSKVLMVSMQVSGTHFTTSLKMEKSSLFKEERKQFFWTTVQKRRHYTLIH